MRGKQLNRDEILMNKNEKDRTLVDYIVAIRDLIHYEYNGEIQATVLYEKLDENGFGPKYVRESVKYLLSTIPKLLIEDKKRNTNKNINRKYVKVYRLNYGPQYKDLIASFYYRLKTHGKSLIKDLRNFVKYNQELDLKQVLYEGSSYFIEIRERTMKRERELNLMYELMTKYLIDENEVSERRSHEDLRQNKLQKFWVLDPNDSQKAILKAYPHVQDYYFEEIKEIFRYLLKKSYDELTKEERLLFRFYRYFRGKSGFIPFSISCLRLKVEGNKLIYQDTLSKSPFDMTTEEREKEIKNHELFDITIHRSLEKKGRMK